MHTCIHTCSTNADSDEQRSRQQQQRHTYARTYTYQSNPASNTLPAYKLWYFVSTYRTVQHTLGGLQYLGNIGRSRATAPAAT